MTADLDIFLVGLPGLEALLAEEARALGLASAKPVPGGVEIKGGWEDVWRANLSLRGASRVLVRLGGFPAAHLSQLDKRGRTLPWAELLTADVPVKVEATTKRSKIYHSGAAAERIGRAITAKSGAPISGDGEIRVMVRVDKDFCTVSLDTSGELLHRRGFKKGVAKAPLRETQAALFLSACGYTGSEPVLDPMCGSGTFVIEAAEMAAGLAPGRERHFAFERFKSFNVKRWAEMKAGITPRDVPFSFFGFDQDGGAIAASTDNAERSGVSGFTTFRQQNIAQLTRPEGPPGLVIVNPPYGVRVGEGQGLRSLYETLGRVLTEGFSGWRVGLVTTDPQLARATRLPFGAPGPIVPHGSLKIRLWQTGPLD